MATSGIRVGDNLNTQLPNQLRLNTDYGFLMVATSGIATVNLDANGNGIVTIPHNLGYAPAFMVFRKGTAYWPFLDANSYANAYFPIGGANHWTQSAEGHAGIFAYTDATNLYIQVISGWAKLGAISITFKYYVLLDQIELYSGANKPANRIPYGTRVAKTGKNVLTSGSVDWLSDLQYKVLQYQSVNLRVGSLTLPEMWTSWWDKDQEEGTYIDFYHGLGYPPMFMFWASSTNDYFIECPYSFMTNISKEGEPSYQDYLTYEVAAFCDSQKVRVSYWRRSIFDIINQAPGYTWDNSTLYIKCFMFSENMAV